MSAYDYLLDRVRESQERERAAKMEADRCQQLAALEAEIGRLQIGAMMVSSLDDIVSDVSVVNNSPHNPHLWTHLWCLIEKEQDGLITRWRKLHAEGAETEAATERQEGER